MRLGVSSFAFGWACGVRGHEPTRRMTEHDLIDFAQAHALDLVQFGDNLPLHTFDDGRIEKLVARTRAEKVDVEIGARGLTARHLDIYVGLAKRLHAGLVRFVIDGPDYEPSGEEVVAIVREAAPALARENIALGIENHDRFPVRQLRQIVEQVGSPQVGICLDTANSLGAGEGLMEVLDQLEAHTLNLHVKDFVIRRVSYAMGFEVYGAPAGRGMLDVPSVLARLEQVGRCRSATLETWTPPEPRLEDTIAKERRWAEDSLTFLRPLFSRKAE